MAAGVILSGNPKAPIDRAGLNWLWGTYWFTPGMTNLNVVTCLFAVGASLALMTFMNFVQPYVLSDILQIPQNEQGRVTGSLAAMQEVVVICMMGFVGAWSDKVGRRTIFAAGFAILGVGYIIYPLADTVVQLYVYRILFAVGTAMIPVMMSACIQDYSQDATRGKWVGLASVFNGMGVVAMSLGFARMPSWFEAAGYMKSDAAIYSFWVVGAAALVFAVIIFMGLAKITGAPKPREPILKLFREGIGFALINQRAALSYYSAMATRGDVVIVGTFFSAWFVAVGKADGLAMKDIFKLSGPLFGIAIQGSALIFAAVMGFICDRVNRVTGMIIAFTLSTIGYGAMGLIDDPFKSFWIIPVCIILGCGETANVVAGGALIGQEAPGRIRGSVMGTFNLCGAVGIALCVGIGGYVFDHFAFNAPFLMMGIINATVLLWAIWLRLRESRAEAASVPQPAQ